MRAQYVEKAAQALKELHEEGYRLDITCFNIVMQAAVQLKRLSIANSLYNRNLVFLTILLILELPSFQVVPDVRTLNTLLEVCRLTALT